MAQSLSANLSFKENPNVAYSNSFIQIANDIRPLYAQATYLANASDIGITLNAESLEIDLTTLESIGNTTNTLLKSVTAADINVPGFQIPPYDEIDLSYVGSTNNIQTANYKKNSTSVLSLSFGYIPNPPTTDNALLKTVKKI